MRSLLKYLTPSFYSARRRYRQVANEVFAQLAVSVLHVNTNYIVIDHGKFASERYSRLMVKETVYAVVREAYRRAGVPNAYYHESIQYFLDGWAQNLVLTSVQPSSLCFGVLGAQQPEHCGIITGDKALHPLSEMDEVTRFMLHDHLFDISSKRLQGKEPIQYTDSDVNLLLFPLQKTESD